MHVFMGLETSWKRRSSQLLFVDENILTVGESIWIVVDSREEMLMDYVVSRSRSMCACISVHCDALLCHQCEHRIRKSGPSHFMTLFH